MTLRRLAPEGVFFVTEDITVRIVGGLIGVPLGTQVTMVKDLGSKMLVTDGRDQFEVDRSKVTNDLNVSAALIKRYQSSEAAEEKYRAQQEAILLRQQQAELDYLKKNPLATPTPSPHK